jgi:hypothetical protein
MTSEGGVKLATHVCYSVLSPLCDANLQLFPFLVALWPTFFLNLKSVLLPTGVV